LNTQSIKDAKRYNILKVRLKLLDILVVAFFLILFQFFLSSGLKQFAENFTPNFHFTLTIYILAFSLVYYGFNFFLHFYSSFALEHRFKLSNQSLPNWLLDDIKSSLLSLIVFFIFIQAFYFFLRAFPSNWWIIIAFFWFFITVIIAKITPILIIPLFFKYSSVEESLKKRIIGLSVKSGIKVLDVFKIDFSKKTNKLNACVTGIGRSRRVLLADNLIREFADDEIAGVLAHEFGHHKLFHIWKLMLFGALATFLSFFALHVLSSQIVTYLGAQAVYDIKILPAILLVLFLAGFILMPIQNAFSRVLERQADIFALSVTRDSEAYVSLMNKLATRNLSDPNPSKIVKFLFYSHPPISERISLAKSFKPS